eukprot:6198598-Pleurochrysis_carterae.AAC.1
MSTTLAIKSRSIASSAAAWLDAKTRATSALRKAHMVRRGSSDARLKGRGKRGAPSRIDEAHTIPHVLYEQDFAKAPQQQRTREEGGYARTNNARHGT